MGTQTYAGNPKKPDEQLLTEPVRRLVQTLKPLRIFLFGSAAHSEMGPNSDIDVSVIVSDGFHRRRPAQAAYRRLRWLGFANDIVVVTESEVREHTGNPSLVLHNTLQEGKETHRAAGQADAWSGGRLVRRDRGRPGLTRAPLPEGAVYEDLCYHAPQAAEKALKAVHLRRGWTFRCTHESRTTGCRVDER